MSRISLFLNVFFLLFINFLHSQKLYFEKVELGNPEFETKLVTLSKKLIKIYTEKDSLKYADNYFRLQVLNRDYDGAIKTLNKIRYPYVNSYPYYAKTVGFQFEQYILAKQISNSGNFTSNYEQIFTKNYQKLPLLAKQLIPESFKFKEGFNKKEVQKILKDSIIQDSISIKNAVLLCKHFNYHTLISETFSTAIPLLKKLENEEFFVKDSVVVKTKKGNEITLFYVFDKKIKHPKPSILHFSTYIGNNDYFISAAKINADRGYNIIYAFSRGIYLSKDEITPFEFEVEDVNEVIDWITKQTWSDGKVGMIGGSYDGFSQWAATKNLHPALKTIIPAASVGFGIDFPMFNNCFSPYMLRWLTHVKKKTDFDIFENEKKWLSVYNTYYKTGAAFNKLDSIYGKINPVFQKWLKHPSFDSYWQSKLPYKRDFTKINIPVLTLTGYYDVDQRGAMYYYDNHLKYNKNTNHYFVIGPYGHNEAVSGAPSEEYKGYKIDSVANIDLKEISLQWFDYILKGQKKPEFLKDKVNYQVMGTNQWKSASSIDKISNKKLKLYLNKTKLLKSKPNLDFISQTIDFRKREDTLQNFDDEKILDSLINKADLKDKIVFESDAFDTSFEINGSITGKLKAAINKKDMDITISAYEKLPSGKYFKLSHEYYARASYTKDNTKRKLLNSGKIETIPVHNTFFTSKKIEKGSKLILILGIKNSPDGQINYGTGKDVSEETIADAKEPLEIKWYNDSYVEIPISEK